MRRLLVTLLIVGAALLAATGSQAASYRPTIYVWNSSTTLADSVIKDALPVWQAAIDNDFAPAWNANAKLAFSVGQPAEGELQIEIADDSDVWDALAYHGTYGSAPYARVFVRTAVEAGYNWEGSLTHELWEMLADPMINRTIEVRAGVFYALEVADPVEDDSFAYWRVSPGGMPVAISDFVLESWYRPLFGLPPYDFAAHVKKPLQVLKGGYIEVWRGKGKWLMIDHFRPATALAE